MLNEDFTSGVLNQYTVAKGQNLSYDGNGNLSNDGTNQYTYNAENRLIAATGTSTSSYVYDAFNRRASKTVNGATTNYLYDGDQVIAEYDGSGTLLKKFIFGPGIDEPIFMEGVDNRYYYHADVLGSIVGLTNNTGAFSETYAYSSWGQVVSGSSVGNFFMYTGRRLDVETGLYYYRARQYSAELRRFLQPDPIGFAGGMNLYAYVGNSPWNYVDPWGLDRNYHIPGSDHYKSAEALKRTNFWKAYSAERPYFVSGHGGTDSKGLPIIADYRSGNRNDLTPEKLAVEIVKDTINFHGQDILLTACNSGKGLNSFAQRLAEELFDLGYNVTVIAPTDLHQTTRRFIGPCFYSTTSEVLNGGIMDSFRGRR